MPLSLFGHNPQSRVEDCIGSRSEHAHTFGGHSRDFQLEFVNAPLPLHLIYCLDLRDPLLPFTLPGCNFLPLLYSFNYGTECCYQVVSDTKIVLLHPSETENLYPPWAAPEFFPIQSTSFSPKSYDPTNADDVMNWKGVFGWDGLGGHERDRALELAKERSSLTIEDGLDDDWTYADVISSMYDPPFAQSKPAHSCENPDCTHDQLQVIALQDHVVPSELIWPDKNVQTIWEMCNSCLCITVSNQCT